MMQQVMRDEDGDLWEVDAAGNVIGPAQPVAPPSVGRVFTLPPNPKDVAAEARNNRNDATAAADRAADNVRADRQLAIAEAAAARAASSPEANAAKVNADAKIRAANAIRRQLGQMREIYERSFKGAGPVQSTGELLPTADAERMRALAKTMRADLKPLIRGPSEGTFTEGDQKLLDELIPDPRAFDAYNETIFAELDNRVNDTLKQFGGDVEAGKAEQRADNEVPDPTNGANTKPDPEIEAATGDTRYESNDRLNSKIDSLISAGSFEMANAVLRKEGLPPISPIERQKIQQWQKANPGKAYTASQIGRDVPLTTFQSLSGSPLGAGAARYANAATGGIVGAMAGEKGQGALDAMRAANPKASLLGDILGGLTGAVGAEAGAAAALGGRGAAWLAPRLGDALYGASTGFNAAQEGEGAEGALWGAGAGILGGALGQGAANAVGSAFRGVRDPTAQLLRERGVPLTVGQALGNSGGLGKFLKSAEDSMTGIPGPGTMINARRLEGLEANAMAMSEDALRPIGGTPTGYGEAAVNDMLGQGGNAYDAATAGAQVPLDPQFSTDEADVRALAGGMPPDLAQRFSQAIDNRFQPITSAGELTGESYQQAMRGLKGYRAETPKPGFEQDYRDALGQGMDALTRQMNRGGGNQVVSDLANADAAWKNIKVLEKATQAAKNGGPSGEIGLPTPAQYNTAAQAASNKFGGPRPMGDLIDAGQSVLPSRVPDSGTASRGLMTAGIVGAGALGGGAGAAGGDAQLGGGLGLGTALMLAAGGSKPVQSALTKMLLDRPELAIDIGDALRRNSRIGGWTGAGVLTPLTVGN